MLAEMGRARARGECFRVFRILFALRKKKKVNREMELRLGINNKIIK